MLPDGLALVAFDLDNTLYDEGSYFAAAIDVVAPHVAARSGVPAHRIAARLGAILRAKGKHYHRLFSDVLGEVGLDDRTCLDEVLALFRSIRPRLAPFPGVRTLLDDLRGHYRLGLITSGMRAVQENKIALLGLAPCFERIVYSSTLSESKPSAVPFHHLCAALAVEPARALYVGDNPLHDFKGANDLGMATVRVQNAEFDGTSVPRGWDARYRVERVTDLRGWLL